MFVCWCGVHVCGVHVYSNKHHHHARALRLSSNDARPSISVFLPSALQALQDVLSKLNLYAHVRAHCILAGTRICRNTPNGISLAAVASHRQWCAPDLPRTFVCVCVCVCVRARARVRVRVRACVCRKRERERKERKKMNACLNAFM